MLNAIITIYAAGRLWRFRTLLNSAQEQSDFAFQMVKDLVGDETPFAVSIFPGNPL